MPGGPGHRWAGSPPPWAQPRSPRICSDAVGRANPGDSVLWFPGSAEGCSRFPVTGLRIGRGGRGRGGGLGASSVCALGPAPPEGGTLGLGPLKDAPPKSQPPGSWALRGRSPALVQLRQEVLCAGR